MKNKTVASSRKVTRTVEVILINATAVNLDDKSVVTMEVQIPSMKYRTNVAKEKAIQNALSGYGNYKYVTHEELGSKFFLYSMPESEYLASATVVAVGDSKDEMQKVESNLEAVEEVEEQ